METQGMINCPNYNKGTSLERTFGTFQYILQKNILMSIILFNKEF